MSGPKTSQYELDRRNRQAEANRQREAAVQAAKREEQRQREAAARAAERQRLERLRQANQDAQGARAKLVELSLSMTDFINRYPSDTGKLDVPGLPRAPDPASQADLERYIVEVNRICQQVESHIRQISANAQFKAALAGLADLALAPPRTAAELLNNLANQASAHAGSNDQQRISNRKNKADKLTKRIHTLGLQNLPTDFRVLMEEFLSAASDARADLLGDEIQMRIQQLNDDLKRQQQEMVEASALLDEFSVGDAFDEQKIKEQLMLAATGIIRLSSELRAVARSAIAVQVARRDAQAHLEKSRIEQDEAARILNEVLGDMGYEVESISHTLFAEGGKIHFRQPGWDENYYVRMQVLPDRKLINFNMVRTEVTAGTDKEVLQKEDARMENTWCGDPTSGFRKLQQVAKDRGLILGSLREIASGQLPVQVVTEDAIPATLRKKKSARPVSAAAPLREIGKK